MILGYEKVRFYNDNQYVEEWYHIEEFHGREELVRCQKEMAYKDYYLDSSLAGIGTEDFSIDRFNKETKVVFVYIWDGKKRNKGGYRWWTNIGCCRIRKKEVRLVKKYFESKYPGHLIQLR